MQCVSPILMPLWYPLSASIMTWSASERDLRGANAAEVRVRIRFAVLPRRGSAQSLVVGFIAILGLLPGVVRAETPPVHMVLFTHIEDNTPAGPLGSSQSRQNYLLYRNRLIAMASSRRATSVPWSLQPDWKILLAALHYEDATLDGIHQRQEPPALPPRGSGRRHRSALARERRLQLHRRRAPARLARRRRHHRDRRPHLGSGAAAVPGVGPLSRAGRGPAVSWALWRGDILMGSGTPNHVNDPLVSGVWRPRDRDHYFEDDRPATSPRSVRGTSTLAGITELSDLYASGAVRRTSC